MANKNIPIQAPKYLLCAKKAEPKQSATAKADIATIIPLNNAESITQKRVFFSFLLLSLVIRVNSSSFPFLLFLDTYLPQHFLYFLPLPQGHKSFLPTLCMGWASCLTAGGCPFCGPPSCIFCGARRLGGSFIRKI